MDDYKIKLKSLTGSFDEIKSISIDNIENSYNLNNTFDIFISELLRLSMYYFFVENKVQEFKQYSYLSGKLLCYDILINDRSSLQLLEDSTFLLLSDNEKLINNFSKLRHSEYNEDVKQYINFTPCIQAVLREDWKHLEELNSYTRINIDKKRGWKKYQPDLMFFKSFLEKDSKKMKEAILLLVTKWHKRRYDMPLFNELISLPALTYAKLAYIKGYELDIDNPLIPKELLAVKPNNKYWDYDFMKQGEYKNV